jgi:hypothetical protein
MTHSLSPALEQAAGLWRIRQISHKLSRSLGYRLSANHHYKPLSRNTVGRESRRCAERLKFRETSGLLSEDFPGNRNRNGLPRVNGSDRTVGRCERAPCCVSGNGDVIAKSVRPGDTSAFAEQALSSTSARALNWKLLILSQLHPNSAAWSICKPHSR